MSLRLTAAMAGGSVAIVLAGAISLWATNVAQGDSTSVITAVDGPEVTTNPLPDEVRRELGDRNAVDAKAVGTKAGKVSDDDLYLLKEPDGDICVVRVGAGSRFASSCAPRATLQSGGIYLISGPGLDKLSGVLVVPNGYSSVSTESDTAQAIGNAAILSVKQTDRFATVMGDSGSYSIDFGILTPQSE